MLGQEPNFRLDRLHVPIGKSLIAFPIVSRSEPVRHIRRESCIPVSPNPTAANAFCGVGPIERAFQDCSLLGEHDFERGAADRRGMEISQYGLASDYF